MERLLCIISNMNAGGAETFLMKIYRKIDKEKYQMDFCINGFDKCFYEDEIINYGGKIYRIPPKTNSVSEFKKNLGKIIQENGYKAVLRVASNGFGFMDLKIAKKNGARKCSVRSSNSSDGIGVKGVILNVVGRMLYGRYVDVRIAPSDLAAKYTFGERAYRKNKIEILHNGLDLSVYQFKEEKRSLVRSKYNIDDNYCVIGHVGRFMNQKNHGFLIDIFNEIHKKNNLSVLLLVGTGELEQDVRDKVNKLGLNDSVIFTGLTDDVPGLLSAIDVFVFPSFYEGMPNAVLEAQAAGLHCIISDTITRNADVTGLVKYLSLSLSAEKWADEALKYIYAGHKETKKDFMKNEYDIDSVVKKFTELVY